MRAFYTPESVYSDTTTNDSDKTITIPNNEIWDLHHIWVELTSNGTAGNRQLEIQLQDNNSNVLGRWQASIVQAASLTRYYSFAGSNPDLLSFRDTSFLQSPIPAPLHLPSGFKIRIWDNKAVAPTGTGENMIIRIMRDILRS